MRGLRSTLLFILLSFSVLIQNLEPVSATILGLASVAGTGIGLAAVWRWLAKPLDHIGYFFGTVGYGAQVKIGSYVNFATSDDIKSGKYVFLNLASTKHGSFITVTNQPPDNENRRKKMVLYQIKSHEFEKYEKKLTIGCVKYYCRTLQCDLNYSYRTVLTYVDELNRKCIQIESFNHEGHRTMKRIYRERRYFWWYDMVINEKETVFKGLTTFSLLKTSTSTTYKLELNSDIIPVCIGKVKFSYGNFFFISKGGGKASQLTEINFANQPVKPTPKVEDILIWHYFQTNPDSFDTITSLVAICEQFNSKWTCKYHKCINNKNREYKVYDSLVLPLDEDTKFGESQSTNRQVEEFELMFDLNQSNVPENTSNFDIHIYTESNHYTLRPKELNNIKLAKCLRANDPAGKTYIYHKIGPSFRLASIAKYNEIYLVSYAALDSTHLFFNTINMKKKQHQAFELFHEASSRPFLESMLSPYYMNHIVRNQNLYVETFELDLTRLDGILTAKLNNNVTFYSCLYSQFKLLERLKINTVVIALPIDLNSQVFYCELPQATFVVIAHSKDGISILIQSGNTFANADISTMQELFNHSGLSPIFTTEFKKLWKNVTLDFDDTYISEHIEVLICSYNTAMFKTQYGKRISKIIWKGVEIKISKGWPIVTKIIYMEHNLLLIDVIKENKINRELYKLDEANKKAIVMSNKTIDITIDNLDKMALMLNNSLFDLYPNNLPVKISFDNPKTLISEFETDNMKIAHSNIDLLLTPGDITAHGNEYRVQKNHKWKQVFKYQGHSGSDFYNIFVLAEQGMYYYFRSEDKQESEKHLRDPFNKLSENSIPLLVESVYLPGIKIEVARVRSTHILTYKSGDNNKILNPIIFGKHEIKLLGSIQSVTVTRTLNQNNLYSISIEVTFVNSTNGKLVFTQNKFISDLYKLTSKDNLDYQDDSINFLDLVKDQSQQNIIDFNNHLYPLDVRYMILNANYYYFTGYTREEKFTIKFGEESHDIIQKDTRYNIWVRYPYGKVTTCVMMLSYIQRGAKQNVTIKHDNHGSDFQVKRPSVKFNWGILSNVEATLVNRTLLSMAAQKEEFFPVDLNLNENTTESVIMKLKVDDNTFVYTTVSTSLCVINNIRFKNAVIKGVPKQLAKQVFVSRNNNENIVVIATKTISKVLLNAYLINDNTFDMVDIAQVDCNVHRGLKSFQMCG